MTDAANCERYRCKAPKGTKVKCECEDADEYKDEREGEDKEKDENGNPIVHVDLSKLTASRTNLKCQECQQKGGGVVQCLSKKCMMGYHKTCAQRAKCIAEYAETSKGDVMACMFCPKHSTPDLAAWRLTCTRSGGNI